MKFLNDLTLKKAFLIFLGTFVINFLITFLIYSFNVFPKEFDEYTKIAEFFIKKVNEQEIDFKINNNGLEIIPESYLISTNDFPVELNFENLLYISKNANYADFKDKNTFAILNNKELVLNIENEYQNIPLESFVQSYGEIVISKDSVENFITTNYLENNQLRNILYLGFIVDRFFNLFIISVWGYLILGNLVFYVLKFSNIFAIKADCQKWALLYSGIFYLIQPVFYYLRWQPSLIYIYLAGFLLISFYYKNSSEKSQ